MGIKSAESDSVLAKRFALQARLNVRQSFEEPQRDLVALCGKPLAEVICLLAEADRSVWVCRVDNVNIGDDGDSRPKMSPGYRWVWLNVKDGLVTGAFN